MSPAFAPSRRSAGFVNPTEPSSVPFRSLRTAVDLGTKRDGGTALMFTSTHPREGTSTMASNHALLASSTGRSTLLIDANLSRPVLHTRLGEDRRPGLVDVAAGGIGFEEAIRRTSVGQVELNLLPAGSPVHGTVDVLSSEGTADILSAACRLFDLVIIDTPPILTLPDAAVVSAHREVDTVVVVGRRQRRSRATRTITELRRAGANVIGVVVNTR
jgi:capsular exopolysaccharide synthesis family protein